MEKMMTKNFSKGDKVQRTGKDWQVYPYGKAAIMAVHQGKVYTVLRQEADRLFLEELPVGYYADPALFTLWRRQMVLPTEADARKNTPITTGVLDYFPLALAAVAQLSKAGNDQHNHGQPLHWAREKSTDHADCIARHLIDRGTLDTDGQRHSAKLAWRALAALQVELEAERNAS